MKMKLSICFISVFLVMQTCVMARSNGTADSVLNNIQERVYNAFVSDVSQKTEKLQELKGQLGNLDKGKQSAILVYWRAYLQFYMTILYSQSGKKSNAKEEVDFGIELLSNLPSKSSEDFALLARLESIALQFAGMNIMGLSKSMSDNIQRALQLDKDNLRANFVYGSIDYYTPAEFGGGKHAEEYLLRSIQLPEQRVKGGYSPSWGKDEAYELLINLYVKNKEQEKAKSLYEEAVKKYPKNFQIISLKDRVYK